MTRWLKNETKFTVNVNPNNNGEGGTSYVCRIPKPIIEKLGFPNSLSFIVDGRTIVVKAGDVEHVYVSTSRKGERKK